MQTSEATISTINAITELAREQGRPTLSFEFFPPKDDQATDSLYASVDRLAQLAPDFISVTYGAGGSNRERSLAVVERLAAEVPTIGHLTCVGASREGTLDIIHRYEDAGVAAILALRGDAPKDNPNALAEGELKTALELVELAKAATGLEVGVAAFPEGHPESANLAHDIRVLKLKADAGADFAMTQLFFSAQMYVDLVESARAVGVTMPIVPGLMPISNAKQVLRMAELSGAKVPTELVAKLESADEATSRALGMEFTAQLGLELLAAGAPGLHIFTLNQSAAATEIAVATGLA
jgi:methylenetetrahydrofolate reductase (NADPH)